MIMTTKKQLWSLARMFLPGLGFAVTCFGAYLVSQNESRLLWRVVPAYILMGLGFLAVLVGVFWTVCHNMKSKMYMRRAGGRERHIQIYSIERPSFFPPSYEESEYSQVTRETPSEVAVEVDGIDVVILAPPLYNADSSEAPDCTWSWERPPRYSQVELALQGEEERRVASTVP